MQPTTSLIEGGTGARCRLLHSGWRVADVADACRTAALLFTTGACTWGKRELAHWLVGPYRRAIELANDASKTKAPRVRAEAPVDETSVTALLARAHAQVVTWLRTCGTWKDSSGFAREMIDSRLVVGVIDAESGLGYAPAAPSDMRLVDRVRSLFVADYLTRPEHWARFRVCDLCGRPTFDAHAHTCPEAECDVAPRSERRVTLVGLGDTPPHRRSLELVFDAAQ